MAKSKTDKVKEYEYRVVGMNPETEAALKVEELLNSRFKVTDNQFLPGAVIMRRLKKEEGEIVVEVDAEVDTEEEEEA